MSDICMAFLYFLKKHFQQNASVSLDGPIMKIKKIAFSKNATKPVYNIHDC